jgi:hypothetical protein
MMVSIQNIDGGCSLVFSDCHFSRADLYKGIKKANFVRHCDIMGNDLLSEGFIDFLTIFPMGKEKGIQPKHVQDCLNLFAVFHNKELRTN